MREKWCTLNNDEITAFNASSKTLKNGISQMIVLIYKN